MSMAKIVVELTNRCNLSCQHCFAGRHAGRNDLPLDIFCKILDGAKANGFDHLDFTGGDPTLHPRFLEVIEKTHEAGYRFGFNTNGWNFSKIYARLLAYRESLAVVTFSLDGATEASHDRLRGKGSYRRVMSAMSVCVVEDIPFTINSVVTAHNRHDLDHMMQLATRLSSRGLRFGHLMPSPGTTSQGYDLSPWDRKVAEAGIWNLKKKYPIPIEMAAGHYTTNLFPCASLHMLELNIDCYGNLTKCCHLSGHGDGLGRRDIISDLGDVSFSDAYQQLLHENEQFQREKMRRLSAGVFQDSDFFPCWYCSLYYKKVDWLRNVEGHPWGELIRETPLDSNSSSVSSHHPSSSAINLE